MTAGPATVTAGVANAPAGVIATQLGGNPLAVGTTLPAPLFSGTQTLVGSGTDYQGNACLAAGPNSFLLATNGKLTGNSLAAGVYQHVCVQAVQSGVPSLVTSFNITAIAAPTNVITVADAGGSGQADYPFQFGRPFIDGAIPHAPQVLINGVAAPSQADVKNRYPDGSVEFAVVAVVIPSIPASGSVTLSFQDTSAASMPMTLAAMEALHSSGKASMTLTPRGGGSGGGADAGTMLAAGFCASLTASVVAQTMICGDNTAARTYDIGFGDGHHPFRPSFYATFWPGLNAVSVRLAGESGLVTEL